MFEITVHITGLDNARARFAKLGASLYDFSGAFTGLAEKLILFYGDTVINNEGTPLTDTRWPALKASTVAYKTKHWPGRGPEVRSGFMQQSFYPVITPESLFIGNKAPYFKWQQQGTTDGVVDSPPSHPGRGRNLPARPMIGINTEVEEEVKLSIEADVRAKIDASNA